MSRLNKKQSFFKLNKYLCFYDSEFNAYDKYKNPKYPQEVISIGFCIVDIHNTIVEKYYSLIKLKAAKKITNRCTEITGITNNDMKKAKPFIDVIKKIIEIIKKYNIDNIYCYGTEDKKALIRTSELYTYDKKIINLCNKFVDIRTIFSKDTNGKINDQGMNFLKKICELDGEVLHNALEDAIDLSQVFNVIYGKGFNLQIYKKLMIEREEISCYKRAKVLKENQSIVAPTDIIKAKNKIVAFLNKTQIPNLNNGTKKAIIDDLNILLVEN